MSKAHFCLNLKTCITASLLNIRLLTLGFTQPKAQTTSRSIES